MIGMFWDVSRVEMPMKGSSKIILQKSYTPSSPFVGATE